MSSSYTTKAIGHNGNRDTFLMLPNESVTGIISSWTITDNVKWQNASFEVEVIACKRSCHALKGVKGDRFDVWFKREGDDRIWHGVKVGSMHLNVHCRPTKRTELAN